MEWPKPAATTIPLEELLREETGLLSGGGVEDAHANYELLIEQIATTLVTKEIYARAASACLSDITVDHDTTGLRGKVESFLARLKSRDVGVNENTGVDRTQEWIATEEHRNVAQQFVELMSFAGSIRADRLYEICQGGLDAVHDLFKYRVPSNGGGGGNDDDLLSAKDAYVLCQSLASPKLGTERLSGSRSPDLDYRFGLFGETTPVHNESVDINDVNSMSGTDACRFVTDLRNRGCMETSACSLAKHTIMASSNALHSGLMNKTFVVIGCDHPLAPTKSLLRIPGVTVFGVPTSWNGLDDVLEYARYISPDSTSFLYPTGGCGRHDGNYVISYGPHIAQWILDNTKNVATNGGNNHELVIVPMASSPQSLSATAMMEGSGSTSSSSYDRAEMDVRYATASDLIVQRVLRARHNGHAGGIKISLWMYQNSTTCMVVPPASSTKAKELLQQRPSHEPWIRSLSRNTVLTPTVNSCNSDDDVVTFVVEDKSKVSSMETKTVINKSRINHDYSIVNGILTKKTPHHVLAEMIRVWRCLLTNLTPQIQHDDLDYDDDFDDDVSTLSRNGNPTREIHVFAPYAPLIKSDFLDDEFITSSEDLNVKIFEDGTASSLMTSIGLATLLDPIVNRPMPTLFEDNDNGGEAATGCGQPTPFSLFWNGSVHGGIWNCPYTLDSMSGYTGYILGKIYRCYDSYYVPYIRDTLFNSGNTIPVDDGSQRAHPSSTSSLPPPPQSAFDVLAVPSTLGQEMPDVVRERLEILA